MTLFSAPAFRRGFIPLIVFLSLLYVVGCDGAGDKLDSQYSLLSGRWEVQVLRVDQRASYRDLGVRFEFRDFENGRGYRLSRVTSEDTTTIRGSITLPGPNTLRMAGGIAQDPLIWSFDFGNPDELNSSVRFRLERTFEEGARSFLRTMGLSGGASQIEMDLVRSTDE